MSSLLFVQVNDGKYARAISIFDQVVYKGLGLLLIEKDRLLAIFYLLDSTLLYFLGFFLLFIIIIFYFFL